jgi:hypothetical protein
MDVPLLASKLPVMEVEVMFAPGAKRSRQGP